MVWNGYQRRAEADGKIVGVHHVFVTENIKTVLYSINQLYSPIQYCLRPLIMYGICYLNSERWFKNANK